MSAKKHLSKFLRAIVTAPEGALFEVGLMWDERNGWRVYQRVGEKALAMNPEGTRQIAATFDKVGARPEWRNTRHGLEEILGQLRPLADEAEQKNRNKIVPPGGALFMQPAGSA